MQTYTHVLTGAMIGAVAMPHDPSAIAVGAAGGFFPDSVIGLQVLTDKLEGRKPFSNESEGSLWFYLKEVSHSPLWLLGLFVIMAHFKGKDCVAVLFVGIALHWFTDILTHCGPEFRDTDQSLAFPFYQWGWCPKLGQIFGIWEYRYNYKVAGCVKNMFAPKPFETAVCLVLLTIIMLRLWC